MVDVLEFLVQFIVQHVVFGLVELLVVQFVRMVELVFKLLVIIFRMVELLFILVFILLVRKMVEALMRNAVHLSST